MSFSSWSLNRVPLNGGFRVATTTGAWTAVFIDAPPLPVPLLRGIWLVAAVEASRLPSPALFDPELLPVDFSACRDTTFGTPPPRGGVAP